MTVAKTLRYTTDISDWGRCHHCGNDQLEGDSIEVNGEYVDQQITCLRCDATWLDVFFAHSREESDDATSTATD